MREQHGPILQEESQPRFGNYDLVHRIDVGGMGEVYLAHQRSAFGRAVAIKIIRSDLVHDITARARFLREAEVSAHLKHEHILPLFEFGEDQGRLFLVTPYIEGGTLARRLQSGPLSLSEVRQLFVPLVQAVAYIHRRGVIHRDLKPTNILLDEEDGHVYMRLIDFGIASIQGSTASPPLTTAGNEVGTIAYMAPERLSGVVAPSNDVFSLGVILYQMLTGQFPMDQQALNLPQALEYVVRRCIATSPEDRFASAEEVLNNFEHAYQFLMTSPQVPPVPSTATIPADLSDAPSSIHLSGALNQSSSAPLAEAHDDAAQELMVLQHSGAIPVATPPQPESTFGREDYSAPTTWFDPVKMQGQQPGGGKPARKKTHSTGKRRSFLPLLSAVTIIILLSIIGIVYYAYQVVTATAVTVNFSPQTQVISQVYSLTADPTLQSVNVSTRSIPAKAMSISKARSKTGPTTGQQFDLNCFCLRPSVSSNDVYTLSADLKQSLMSEITRDVQRQIQVAGGRQVGQITFTDQSLTAYPPVGSLSETVTVSFREQGSVRYFLTTDAQSVARQVLMQHAQQVGQNYLLLNLSIATGLPAVQGMNTSGAATIKIAAGCLVEYQFTASQLQAIQTGLTGKRLRDARAFIAHQPGVDPKTVGIHFTKGKSDALPGDPQRITVIPINPGSLPPVQLQNVPTPSFTPTPTQTGEENN